MSKSVVINELEFTRYISKTEIDQCIDSISAQIRCAYLQKDVVIIGVLNGAFMLTKDLIDVLDMDVEVSFVKVSSYTGLSSTGEIQVELDFSDDIKGKHVLIIEDIIDTGLTATFLVDRAKSFGAASVAIAALLVKPESILTDIQIDFCGKSIPDVFVVGYGMDYNQKGRHLPEIYRKMQDNS